MKPAMAVFLMGVACLVARGGFAASAGEAGVPAELVLASADENPVPAANLTVTLKSEAISRGETVLLSEVAGVGGAPGAAQARLSALSVGRAALPGQSRTLSAAQVLTALRQGGVSTPVAMAGATESKVTAVTQVVTGQRIADAVRAAVRAEFEADRDMEVETEVTSNVADLSLRPGEVSITPEIPDCGLHSGAQSLRVRVAQDGRTVSETFISVRIRLTATVQVAAVRLQPGDTLTADDIRSTRKELSNAEFLGRTDAGRFVNLRAKNAIAPGQLLTRNLFALPLLIKKGDAIIVYVHRGSLDIAATAEARNDAAQDEPVRVKLESGAEVGARASGVREATIDDLRRRLVTH